MRKFFYTVILLSAAGFLMIRSWDKSPRAEAIAPVVNNTEYQSPTLEPTQTPVPSATIGYESTAIVAQQTADEARRVNAQTTAQHEANQLVQLQLTADAEQRNQAVALWTAVMASTAIPLTATQQAAINTQMANQIILQSGQLTATYQAPTQMAVIAEIENKAKYARIDRVVQVIGVFAIAIFCVSLSVFLFRWKPVQRPEPKEPETETVVHLRRDHGQGSYNQVRAVVPCSPEQLTELAEMAVNGEKRFGINRLERTSRTLRNRDVLIAVREFLVANNLAIKADDGLVTLNENGEDFLCGWFDSRKLSGEYEFAPEDKPEPEPESNELGDWQELHKEQA